MDNPIEVIDIFPPWTAPIICCVCGKEDVNQWGIPIDMETALIADNDFEGEWAGKPACRDCFMLHAIGFFVGTYPRF
jgi:hypothetical protein